MGGDRSEVGLVGYIPNPTTELFSVGKTIFYLKNTPSGTLGFEEKKPTPGFKGQVALESNAAVDLS